MTSPSEQYRRSLRFLGALAFLGALLLLSPLRAPSTALVAQTTDDSSADSTQSQYDRWREVLRYGIESEMLDVLAVLDRERIDDLDEEVKPLFSGNFSDTLLITALRYFGAIETYTIVPETTAILRDNPDEQNETLLLQALYYLRGAPKHTLPADTIEAIRALTADTRVTAARAAVDTLAILGDASDSALMQQLLTDSDTPDDVRGGAILAIGELKIIDSLDRLHRILEDRQEHAYLRQHAATSIGKLAQERSLPVLTRFSLDGNSRLRATVIEALAQYQQQEANTILHDALRDSNDQVRLAAVRAFQTRSLSKNTLATLQYKATRDSNRQVQLIALSILANTSGSEGVGYIREQIRDTKTVFAIRAEMFGLLVEHDYPDSSIVLMELIRDEQLTHKRRNLLLELIARRLAMVDAPSNAIALYSLLLESTDPGVVSHTLQGVSFNDASYQLREQLTKMAEQHKEAIIRGQAQLILDRWSKEKD